MTARAHPRLRVHDGDGRQRHRRPACSPAPRACSPSGPTHARRLLADPGLIPNAVEELLRLTSPVQNLARTTTPRRRRCAARRSQPARRCCSATRRRTAIRAQFGPTAGGPRRRERPIIEDAVVQLRDPLLHRRRRGPRCRGRVVLEEMLRRCPAFAVDVAAGRMGRGQLRAAASCQSSRGAPGSRPPAGATSRLRRPRRAASPRRGPSLPSS